MAGNYKSFYECYLQLEKNFASIFTIPSEGALTSIFFCFKDKIEIKEYQEKFKTNREKAEKSNFIDFSVVSYFYKGILIKLEDMSEQRKIMEENAKKI
jgi:2-phospho-L-lactate guanylyltransferase (CobY/MobA/RfbA family)